MKENSDGLPQPVDLSVEVHGEQLLGDDLLPGVGDVAKVDFGHRLTPPVNQNDIKVAKDPVKNLVSWLTEVSDRNSAQSPSLEV